MMRWVPLLLTLMLMGCEDSREARENWVRSKTGELKENIFYFRDGRTGLCFAATQSGHLNSIAWVPCLPSVVAVDRKSVV